MNYKPNTPNYNTKSSVVSNFKDFMNNLDSNKEDLKELKRGMKKNTSDTHKIPKNAKLRFDKVTRKMTDTTLPEVEDKIDQIEDLQENTSVNIASMSRLITEYELSHTPFENRGFDEALTILKKAEDLKKAETQIESRIGEIQSGEVMKKLDDVKKKEIIGGMSDFLKNLKSQIINESHMS